MRAVRIDGYGGREVLRHTELPIPRPGPGEALVKVAFAGVNMMDVLTREGHYASSRTYPVRAPLTLGMEGSGTISELGPGVNHLSPGTRVAWCISWGSYADYAVVPVERLTTVPDAVGLDLAAAAMFHGCTAQYLISDVGALGPGSTCLVQSASGGVGRLLVQLAKRRGATVLATTSSLEKADFISELGADEVFVYGKDSYVDTVLETTQGGVDVVFDAVGAPTLRDSLRVTKTRGLVVNYGAVGGAVADLNPLELGEEGSLFFTRPRLTDYLSGSNVQSRAKEVFDAISWGGVSIPIGPRYGLEQAGDALSHLEERRASGKPLLEVGR